jgi:hypothetical protein
MSVLRNEAQRQRAPAPVQPHATLDLLSPVLALVCVRGDHDVTCYDALKALLDEAAAHGDVIVDLTRCESLDATAMGALIAAHGAAAAHGHRLALLLAPGWSAVRRAVDLACLAAIVPVHTSRRAAFESVGRAGGRPPHAA